MSVDRRSFLKKACLSGLCMCGFSSILYSENLNQKIEKIIGQSEEKLTLEQQWIANLLESIGQELDEKAARKVIRKTSAVHYNDLKMDEMLSGYVGKLDKFIVFIEKEWGWKVEYNKSNHTLIADENKNYCVCPVSRYRKDINSSAMCFCSEGFAEKMFAVVAGVPAKARVLSSIRRGDDRCRYKIVFDKL